MHPFGGTPICPRCSKSVYAAEQIMGPGRKLYHKPCLACTSCGKRLDSYTLLEHDQQPYCKNCHVKTFGTRDLRQANLPNRADLPASSFSPPGSPTRGSVPTPRAVSPPARLNASSPQPMRRTSTGERPGGALSLRPTRALSPVRTTFSNAPWQVHEVLDEAEDRERDEGQAQRPSTPTHTGRVGGLPRTVPLASPLPPASPPSPSDHVSAPPPRPAPVLASTTGTRYGKALGASISPMTTGGGRWGGGTPTCGRCGKTVYFAEQVKAIGKTWHKGCLRCTECGTLLDSSRLTEKEGSPFCQRCYGKLYGPQGGGYALLGKPGA